MIQSPEARAIDKLSDAFAASTNPLRRHHIHLHSEDVGAPSPMTLVAGSPLGDPILAAAMRKFEADGWTVIVDDDHDIDIDYDGRLYIVEAWVR